MASAAGSALPREVFELQMQLGETYARDENRMAAQGKVRAVFVAKPVGGGRNVRGRGGGMYAGVLY